MITFHELITLSITLSGSAVSLVPSHFLAVAKDYNSVSYYDKRQRTTLASTNLSCLWSVFCILLMKLWKCMCPVRHLCLLNILWAITEFDVEVDVFVMLCPSIILTSWRVVQIQHGANSPVFGTHSVDFQPLIKPLNILGCLWLCFISHSAACLHVNVTTFVWLWLQSSFPDFSFKVTSTLPNGEF